MPPSPLEMNHVGQVQNFRVGSSNHILNSMGQGVQRGGGGLVSGPTGNPPPPVGTCGKHWTTN